MQKSHLALAIQDCLSLHTISKSVLFGFSCVCACYAAAQQQSSTVPNAVSVSSQQAETQAEQDQRSLSPTEQSEVNQQLDEFQTDAVYQLNTAEIPQVDQSMVNEIFAQAEEAQQQAALQNNLPTVPQLIAQQNSDAQQLNQAAQTTIADPDLEQLLSTLSTEQLSLPEKLPGQDIQIPELASIDPEQKRGFFYRLFHRDKTDNSALAVMPKIKVTVNADQDALAQNIKAKLSSFTVAAFEDYSVALPQLRILTNQAAEALGYYHAEFKFSKTSDDHLLIQAKANKAVRVSSENIEFHGAGAQNPAFLAIQLAPDLEVGDRLNHGLYENTKTRINTAASDLGFFDSYWRMHDVKVSVDEDQASNQTADRADINLIYQTGERYKFKEVEFRMSDPSKPFPLKESVLRKLVPFTGGADYASWRVNLLSNNLINSRYFNSASVDVYKPDAIEKPPELPADVKALLDEEQKNNPTAQHIVPEAQQQDAVEVAKLNAVEESLFAGVEQRSSKRDTDAKAEDESKEEQLRAQARIDKAVPVVVTLNADKLNNLEAGIGYGTDTGVRLRSQYRRSIVNASGHSFESNMELSQIRQAIDGSYSIPYKNPLTDYFNLVGGYEREDRGDVGQNVDLDIESGVLGAERVIKRPLGEWQQTMSVRYRLDRLTTSGVVDEDDIPDAFRVVSDDPEQESLLFGYSISRTEQDNRVNPNRGFRQYYQISAGSESLLTEVDMAILNAGWHFIYSLGENYNHQFVGRADFGYILTENFDRVPYNLRFFAGGDQTIRGFDYKSLSTEENDLLIGGQALAVGSIEYNYQFKPGWRAAFFTDFGNAYDAEFKTDTKVGMGLGLRWASPIGPIRIDVGAGVSEDNIPVRLHVFIGSAL